MVWFIGVLNRAKDLGMSATNNRRWYPFLLVLLLAVITLAAVSFGLWRISMERIEQQPEAVQPIEPPTPRGQPNNAAATKEPSGAKTPRVRLPRDSDSEEQIDLTQAGFTDADMPELAGMSQLKVLKLSSNPVGNNGLVHLQQLRKMERLWLNSTKVTNPGLANLQQMTELKELWLSGTFVSDLKPLEKLKHLEYLECAGTQITDEGLASIEGLDSLKVLWINQTQVTDKGLVHLTKLKRLERLFVGHNQITDEGLKTLQAIMQLKMLSVIASGVSREGVREFQDAVPECSVDY
jgi:Leucine-rich repeat (LRR) protein